jgi:RND family efflux transporter MFP subunit
MNKKTLLPKRLLPLAVLLIGAAIAWWLVSTSPEPKKSEKKPPGVLVETIVVSKETEQLRVHVQGTVVPARRVTVLPQVSGRILSVHPSLQPGGILREGERMITIDPSDFRLAMEQRETELKEARAQLELEQGRRSVAQSEWELFKEEFKEGLDMPEQKPELALREPQLAAARARVSRAEAAVKAARLQLERTQIDAPFHALVLEESAAEGQFVSPQQSIAQLVGADRFWVRTAVQPERIPYIDIPLDDSRKGSPAEVVLDLGAEEVRFDGYVSRLEGRLDEQSRMAQLIVTIPDPLGARTEQPRGDDAKEKFPLLLNAYVDVIIEAGKPVEVFVVPRTAVRGGNQVYVYDNGRLRIRKLDILWERQDAVLARGGLQEGEQLIVSNLSSPVQGMALRLASEERATSTGAPPQ